MTDKLSIRRKKCGITDKEAIKRQGKIISHLQTENYEYFGQVCVLANALEWYELQVRRMALGVDEGFENLTNDCGERASNALKTEGALELYPSLKWDT